MAGVRRIGVLLAGALGAVAGGAPREALIPFNFAQRGNVQAIHDVLVRTLGDESAAAHFDLQMVSACTGKRPAGSKSDLCFELFDLPDGRLAVRGTSAVELARGAAYFLESNSLASFTWNRTGGNRVQLPAAGQSWPKVGGHLTKYRSAPISYFDNVCTFSYSFAWYTFEDWEKWLDWAVLSGINVHLAYTGQEEIYMKAFEEYGVTEEDFAIWSNSPPFLTWSRGQDIGGENVGGPISRSWMRKQWELQIQILQRARALGLVNVLPTFQGNLPPQFRSLFPQANISKTGTAWLDATDPLFAEIQQKYMKILIADFGTDHWYETDGYFDQSHGPWKSQAPKAAAAAVKYSSAEEVPVDWDAFAHSNAVFASMNSTDPDAIWFYQGWIWRGWDEDKLPYMKGFVSAVPEGRFVMLDMWDEVMPEWQKFNTFGYFGAPFIWSVLHNFGGNLGLWGDITLLNNQSFQALETAPSMSGFGAAPEGQDQNPLYYKFLQDVAWMEAPADMDHWLQGWVAARYGDTSSEGPLLQAWRLVVANVYGKRQPILTQGGFNGEKNTDALESGPRPLVQPQPAWYNLTQMLEVWELFQGLVSAGSPIAQQPGFRYDLVNFGREVLAKLSNKRLSVLQTSKTVQEVQTRGGALLELMRDADQLLCSEMGFSAGRWITAARSWGETAEEKDQYEVNARSQTTIWNPVPDGKPRPLGSLNDYANKMWSGQVGGFYAGRTTCWIDQAVIDFGAGRSEVSEDAYVACLASLAYNWTHDFGAQKYPMCMEQTGDAGAISGRLLRKYRGDVLGYDVVELIV